MKVVILTGGMGKRISELSEDTNKCALKVNGIPLIDYSLNVCNDLYGKRLIDKEVIVVTGHMEDDIKLLHDDSFNDINLLYIQQLKPSAVWAIKSVEDYVHKDFLLMLGDEIFINSKHSEMIDSFSYGYYDGILGIVYGNLEEVKKTYTVNIANFTVLDVIEKPLNPYNRLIGTGNCILPHYFFDYIIEEDKLLPQDFVSIVKKCILDNGKFGTFNIADKYFNINAIQDYVLAEHILTMGK